MKKVKFTRKNGMLFRTIKVNVGNSSYKIKRNSSFVIELPEGSYELFAKLDWVSAKTQIEVKDRDQEIIIRQRMSDWYLLLFLFTYIVIWILTYYRNAIPKYILFIYLLITIIPICLNVIVNRSKYFKFELIRLPE